MPESLAVPLIDLIRDQLGPPQGRRGSGADRPWWRCPFHPDRNPSLTIRPDQARWRCFGCGHSGDGIEFLRRLNPGLSYQQARNLAAGGTTLVDRPSARQTRPPAQGRPLGWVEFATGVVSRGEEVLWSPEGERARAYLNARGLRDETIRRARLGYWPKDVRHSGLYPDRPLCVPRGITIPWFSGDDITAVNIRRPVKEGEARKYHLLRGSRRTLYPGRSAIVAGGTLVLTEGEFDCLLLGQELLGLASVVTLGSAGDRRPEPGILLAMSHAAPWYVAGDANGAGETNSAQWLARSGRCRLVVPPAKDWSDAYRAGYQLREWWSEILADRDPSRFDPA